MGGAIARGLVTGGAFELHGFDPSEVMCRKSADIMTIHPTAQDVVKNSDFVLLAVKPQVMRPVLGGLAESLGPETCIISIAAGVTVAQLAAWSDQACPVIRVMPNTPAMVGKGVYALCFDHEKVDESCRRTVLETFSSIGQAHVLPEKLFDAYTGLIGSGPAYVYAFMEGLIDAGVTLGLTRPRPRAWSRAWSAAAPSWPRPKGRIPRFSRKWSPHPAARPSRASTPWTSTASNSPCPRRSWLPPGEAGNSRSRAASGRLFSWRTHCAAHASSPGR
jgi:pyrroline-5-carboxylate reductase